MILLEDLSGLSAYEQDKNPWEKLFGEPCKKKIRRMRFTQIRAKFPATDRAPSHPVNPEQLSTLVSRSQLIIHQETRRRPDEKEAEAKAEIKMELLLKLVTTFYINPDNLSNRRDQDPPWYAKKCVKRDNLSC